MILGSDVSGLTTDAKTAAAQGLSIVVPVYNEAPGLALFHERLGALAATLRQRHGLGSEVIYVDDGSADGTLGIARALPAGALDVQVVSLSRNFGKEAALMAGLDHARRGAVLFMDGDGQHPPDLVEKLVAYWIDDGYDVVYTAKAHRDHEPLLRRIARARLLCADQLGRAAKDSRRTPATSACCRRAPRRRCGSFRSATVSSRASPRGSGFARFRVDYEPAPRAHGITSFSPGRLVGLSIEGLTSFSVAPLRFASLLGLLLATGAFLFGLSILWETFSSGKSVPGYPSLVVGLMTIGGVQLIMIGIVGEYIGKIFSELKGRPIYFVAEHSVKHADADAAREAGERTAAE